MVNYILKIFANVFLFCIKFVPSSLIPYLSTVLAWVFKLCAKKEIKNFKNNVYKIWGIPSHSAFSKMFLNQCIRHQINCALESLKIILKQKLPIIDGFEEYKSFIQNLRAKDKSIIFVTAHIGSWELLAKYTAQAVGDTLYVLAKPAPYEALTKILDYLRSMMNLKVLWINSKSLQKDMIRLVRDKKCIGFVMDQKPLGNKGISVIFFKLPCVFVQGPATLSQIENTEIIVSFLLRESPWKYKLVFEYIDKTQYSTTQELTQAMAEIIEKVIKLYPEQWTWSYKRWKFNVA